MINDKMKFLIAFLIIIIMGVGFYVTIYQKKIATIKQLDETIIQKTNQLSKDKALIVEMPKLKDEEKQLLAERDNIIKENLGTEEAKDFIPNYLIRIEEMVKEIRKLANDPSFDLLALKPGSLQSEEGAKSAPPAAAQSEKKEVSAGETALAAFSTKRIFEMNMEGRYTTLIKFLQELAKLGLKRLVTINRIALSPSMEGETGTSPTLSISIPVTAYLKGGGGR